MERKSQGACREKWRYSDAAEYTGRAVYEISPAGEERTWDSATSNSVAGESHLHLGKPSLPSL